VSLVVCDDDICISDVCVRVQSPGVRCAQQTRPFLSRHIYIEARRFITLHNNAFAVAVHRFKGAMLGQKGWSTDGNVVGIMADVALTTSVKTSRLDSQKALRGNAQVPGLAALPAHPLQCAVLL
jgi:hypothetical protein